MGILPLPVLIIPTWSPCTSARIHSISFFKGEMNDDVHMMRKEHHN